MDDILAVEIMQALHCLVQCILAEAFRIVSRQVFQHLCECSAIHQLQEDPQAILEIERFIALHYRLAITQLHNTDLIYNRGSFCSILRFCEFEGK